ncbi:calcium-binding protein [Streptomyces sp. 6N223]|uniref:calcium-binding protein n=1 Tax=Streptomyces sp. 6N223 TaxID=3457412 RepID=UPI003FD1BBF4
MALAGAGAGMVLWPAPAAAQTGATAHVDEVLTTIHYLAGAGESNDVVISQGASAHEYLIDDVVPIDVGVGCVHPDEADPTRVACTRTNPDIHYSALRAQLGDLADQVEVTAGGQVHVDGQAGDDVMTASGDHGLWGGNGHDTISGAYSMRGDGGRDVLIGTDATEWIFGGWGPDTILGQGGDDHLGGNRGKDEIHGGDGRDNLWGDNDDDVLYGEAGDDELRGFSGEDILYGGDGNDALYGGKHTDQLDGGPGNDEEYQD